MPEDDAIYAVIHQIKHTDGKRMIAGDIELFSLLQRGKVAVSFALQIKNTALASRTMKSFTLRNGELFWKNIRTMGDRFKLTSKFGKVVATRAVAGTFAVMTLGFTILDIKDCVDAWMKDPPTAQSVTEMIDLVTEEIANMCALINDLELNE